MQQEEVGVEAQQDPTDLTLVIEVGCGWQQKDIFIKVFNGSESGFEYIEEAELTAEINSCIEMFGVF